MRSLLLLPLLAGTCTGCNWSPPNTRINIDLGPLDNKYNIEQQSICTSEEGETVECTTQDAKNKFTSQMVHFSPCGQLTPADAMKDHKQKPGDPNLCERVKKDHTAAYQVLLKSDSDNFVENCYNLGLRTSESFAQLDDNDPTRGVKLTYEDGTECGSGKKRSLTVNFECTEHAGPTTYGRVVEYPDKQCEYTINFKTIHACPKACITGSEMCNGNGVCGVVKCEKCENTGTAMCLCDEGYTGAKCDKEGTADNGEGGFVAAAVSLIIGILLLAGLLGLMIYMYMKLQRLAPVDNEAYASLSNKFNELGQIT